MLEGFAILLAHALYLYAGIGLLFGVIFITAGVSRLDQQAAGCGWGFRILILPGSAAFWPLLLKRWVSGPRNVPEERNPNR
jgi:hypothetical protein